MSTSETSRETAARTIEVLRTTEALEAFAGQWAELWQTDANRTPFQHPAWLLPWWHHFGQPDLRAVLVRHGDTPIAFLPFYIYPEPASGVRKLLLLGAGTSDYLDGIFSPACTIADVAAAIRALLDTGGFDTLDTVQLRPESLLAETLRQMGATEAPAEPTSVMPAVALASLPAKIRRNAMYYRNRAARDGTLDLTFARAENAGEYFNTLVRLHGARWQQRGETGVLDDPAVLAWHREALPMLAEAGLLRLASLTRNGEPLGLMYAMADDPAKPMRALYLYLPAFSWEHRDLRPGTVLLALLVDAAARDGFATIDMLRGGEDYKQLWHVDTRPTLALSLRPS